MKLVSNIINELMDFTAPISGALLKTKVLASRIHNKPLQEWVNRELNGYENEAYLPDYRRTEGFPKGNFMNGWMMYSNTLISIAHLEKKEASELTIIVILDSISAVENLTKQKGIKVSLSSSKRYALEQSLVNLGNPGFQILNVHLEIPAAFLSNILAAVRSRLLEFMLEIENQFGQESEIEDLKSKNTQVTTIVNNTITNNGDGVLITTGSENEISASIDIQKSNRQHLVEELKKNSISKKDIDELLNIIDLKIPNQRDKYSVDVNVWIKNMLSKALDNSWDIGISAAGGILSNILAKYYGLT